MFMNIFILNTGRCGSMSFVKACQHIENYSSAHESRINLTGEARLAYPCHHIEVDNRLSWLLGRLDAKYSNQAFYVHLKRNTDEVIDSFVKRHDFGIMKAYREGILMLDNTDTNKKQIEAGEIARDYIETVNENISCFLKDKSHKMVFDLEKSQHHFAQFWESISATGNMQMALSEWEIKHNASK